jgi:hypothetical protein
VPGFEPGPPFLQKDKILIAEMNPLVWSIRLGAQLSSWEDSLDCLE